MASKFWGYTVLRADSFWLALYVGATGSFLSALSFLYCLQIVGHMFAYPVVYDLVADNDEEKQEVAAVLESIIGQCAWSLFAFLLNLHYPPFCLTFCFF